MFRLHLTNKQSRWSPACWHAVVLATRGSRGKFHCLPGSYGWTRFFFPACARGRALSNRISAWPHLHNSPTDTLPWSPSFRNGPVVLPYYCKCVSIRASCLHFAIPFHSVRHLFLCARQIDATDTCDGALSNDIFPLFHIKALDCSITLAGLVTIY